MKVQRFVVIVVLTVSLTMGTTAFAQNSFVMYLNRKCVEFAQRYDYDEEKVNQVMAMYPDRTYSSGVETREDGTQYEFPGIYVDADAKSFDSFNLKREQINLIINGQASQYGNQCIVCGGNTLVPADALVEASVDMSIDDDLLVITYTKGNTAVEIQPYLIAMRKNGSGGYWIPLPEGACARIFDQIVYIPLRAVAEELGINVDWEEQTKTITLK